MANILFPTDFSDNALNAYRYALHVAHKLNANILTFHVYEKPPVKASHLPETMEDIIAAQLKERQADYELAQEKMAKQAVVENTPTVSVKHLLEKGKIADKIQEVSEAEKSNLIVMGTQGASGFREVFIGSNTVAVLEKTQLPVLIVPEKAVYKDIQHIVYATSIDDSAEDTIHKVTKFAKAFDANIHCIHINTTKERACEAFMEGLKEKFSEQSNVSFKVIEGDNILHSIDQYLKENKIDLLAMLTHKRTFLDKLLSISYTQKMAFHSSTPLLVFHYGS